MSVCRKEEAFPTNQLRPAYYALHKWQLPFFLACSVHIAGKLEVSLHNANDDVTSIHKLLFLSSRGVYPLPNLLALSSSSVSEDEMLPTNKLEEGSAEGN